VIRHLPVVLALCLLGCGSNSASSPQAANAQQASKTEEGIIVGVRSAALAAPATPIGTDPNSAFSALRGSLAFRPTVAVADHPASDARAYEYIVRKANAELVSVTQKDTAPLVLAQHVLIICGNQARVVPDGARVSVMPDGAVALASPPKEAGTKQIVAAAQ
jgi:outer membrane lipoprotein SlyB